MGDAASLLRRPGDLLAILSSASAGLVSGTTLLARAGLLRPMRPDVMPRALLALLRDGISPAAAYGYGAVRYSGEVALSDERVSLSFPEAAAWVSAVAAALAGGGVASGDKVGLLCRNHAGFVLSLAALSSLGADVVLMNTSATAAEVAAVASSQGLRLVVHDEELGDRLSAGPTGIGTVQVWRPGESEQIPAGRPLLRRPPRHRSRYILLTSGTTGTAKGAARSAPSSIEPLVAILSRIPLRVRDRTLIASPAFHAWGFGNLALALALSSTVVLRERFDAEATLAAVAQHHVRVLVAVPVMLQRLVDLPEAARRKYDVSSLQVVASSGSAMPAGLATRFMDCFGDVLYNLYGSTEAAWASIATPEELRMDPRTAGRPPYGTRLRIVDERGRGVAAGATGSILVANSMIMAPARKDPAVPAGFVRTGDLGHLDASGLLFVDGREDDMIVSGGENIYPQEIEDALGQHPAVLEAAVVAVEDAEFGQRLRASVVLERGAGATEDELKQYLRRTLARFKVPREIVFLDELPRNAAGKTLRRDLRQSD